MSEIKKDIFSDTDSEPDNQQFLPSVKKQNKTHGLGFCLEDSIYDDKLVLIPFRAKYKKNTSEFLSKFNAISEDELLAVSQYFDNQEMSLIIQCLKINEQTHREFLSDDNNVLLQKEFNDFIEKIATYPLYKLKENRYTLAKNNLSLISIAKSKADLFFELNFDGSTYALSPKIKLAHTNYNLDEKNINIEPLFCYSGKKIYLYKNVNSFARLRPFLEDLVLQFLPKDKEKMFNEIIQPLSKDFRIETTFLEKEKLPAQGNLKKQLYLSDYEGEYIVFKLGVVYNEQLVLLHSQEQIYNLKEGTVLERDAKYENKFLIFFRKLHPDFEQQDEVFYLRPEQLVEDEWLLNVAGELKKKGVEIFGAKDLKSFKYNLNQATVSMNLQSGIDWFDVELELRFGNEKVNLRELRKAILKKQNYVQLKDGSLGLLPQKWVEKFSAFFRTGTTKNDTIRVSNYQFNLIDELTEQLENAPDFLIELQKKKQRLKNLETKIKVTIPKTLKATLRKYQCEGLQWLTFLYENKLGGCLADDMGLGKTIQVIALFAMLKSKKDIVKSHLVVAPTSLIFNWVKEIEKFCPSLKVLVYTGTKRNEVLSSFSKYDVVLSTYGTVLKDIDILKDIPFSYAVLDESQTIKNPISKRYKAVKLLKTDYRLALTGTPIENNTFDLYAQMNFLNPGLLGSVEQFKNNFSKPIDKEKDEEMAKILSQMIHPFLLRRTKEKVAKELPEKTETILYCDMLPEQRKVYDAYKKKYRDYILDKMDDEGEAKSQLYVLAGLTKLRQICNSPALLSDEEDYGSDSVKLDIITDHIKTKIGQHKILVFSQFTGMLALIKERLDAENITYEYLDGKTKNREERVQNFQTNTDVRVFLISLKAGGVGLNLTEADYVYLVDPWWNPAVENQAIDRCYRIGQTKKVMAYKMICRDTIEEKLLLVQKGKTNVASSIIHTDNAKKSFDKAQIKDLFA